MSKPISVVIVEDETTMAMCLEMILKRAGFDICANVGTGEEAIAESERFSPDAVLLDVRLGGEIDGIEAAQQIVRNRNIRIVFMTGYSNPEIRKRAQIVEPVAYLVKPFEFSELIEVLNTLT
jgi:CheY-like chemotaxis protein